jgi:hypothetical protein
MTKIKNLHRRWSRNDDYRAAYDGLEEEFRLARALIEARTAAGLSQMSPSYLRSARHPITTRMSLGPGAGVRSMKYTCCPSGDTSYCVPQCPDPMSGTFSVLATPSVSSPLRWRSTDRPRKRPSRST